MNQYLWSKKTFAFTVRVPNSQETNKREVERHLKIRFGLFLCEPSLPICIKTNKKCSAADPNSLMLFLQYHRLWVAHVVNRDMLWHHCLVWTIVCLLQEDLLSQALQQYPRLPSVLLIMVFILSTLGLSRLHCENIMWSMSFPSGMLSIF